MNHWKKVVKKSGTVIAAGMIAAALTACGGAASTSADGDVRTVYVGVSTTLEKVSFYNEDGELDGLEIDTLKAIDDLLPQYKFEYSPGKMDNTLLGMDTGKLDMGTNNFEYSDERNEKYLFSTEGILQYIQRLTVLADSDYESIEDLAGKTIGVPGTSSAISPILEKYNEDNPDKALNIDYYGSGVASDVLVEGLKQGRWDVLVWNAQNFETRNSQNGNFAKQIGDPLNTSNTYILFAKTDENTQLRDDVDEALRTLKENGTLAEISIKWFGKDYTPEAE